MPHINITTATGLFSFCYYIATPNSNSADNIEPNLPTVIFLHAGYAAQEVFEWQFADRNLRRFNLIGIDMRGFGDTVGVIGEAMFTPTDSAADVGQIMVRDGQTSPTTVSFFRALDWLQRRLGASHRPSSSCPLPDSVFTCIHGGGMYFVNLRDKLVILLQPEEVAFGRMEVYRYWVAMDESTKLNGNKPEVDEELVAEVMTGALQLLFNLAKNNRLQAMAERGLLVARRNWSGSQEALQQSYKANIEWFLKRREISAKELATINVPVAIIHCFEDIAYSLQSAQDLEQSLRQAGVPNVELHRVPGAHYGNATHPESINLILLKFVLSCHPDFKHDIDYPSGVTHASARLSTPFTQFLVQCGYDPSESDSDGE